MPTETIRRLIPTEVRIFDAQKGVCDYVASTSTVDSFNEVIRADGWKFTHFAKNAPFVNSHNYSSIDQLLGKVISFKVDNGKLIERVQWAIDVPDNRLAKVGFAMTQAGYLKAVSVGFSPLVTVTPYDANPAAFKSQLRALGLARLMKCKDNSGAPLVKTPIEEPGRGIASVLGFPVVPCAAAPSANVAGSKVAAFGDGAAYAVGRV